MDVAQWAAYLIVMFTIMIPINGLILLGMINERRKIRKLLFSLWKLHTRK